MIVILVVGREIRFTLRITPILFAPRPPFIPSLTLTIISIYICQMSSLGK